MVRSVSTASSTALVVASILFPRPDLKEEISVFFYLNGEKVIGERGTETGRAKEKIERSF